MQEVEEPVQVKALRNPGRNMTWSSRRKYRTLGDIFKLYQPDPKPVIDPAVAAVDIDELAADFAAFQAGGDTAWSG